jgi:KRAB domain-containing zinc finger protein
MFCGVKDCDRKVDKYVEGSNKERGNQEQLTALRKHNKNKHFICEICREICDDSKHLKGHILTKHIGKEGEMFCEVKNCDRKIDKHVEGSNKERGFQEQLLALTKHNGSKHFICKICCEKCDDNKHLSDHMVTRHIGKEGEIRCGVQNCDKKIGKFVEGSAKERGENEQISALIIHRTGVHDNIRFYVCKICNSTYKKLKEHRLVCNTKYDTSKHKLIWKNCIACQKRFRTDRDLMIHNNKVHLKRYPCNSCSYKATSTYNLIHHKAKHQEGKVICEREGCSFVSVPGVLRKHLYEEHGEGKVFQCNFCEYQAYRPTILLNQEAIHAQGKEIKCSKCEYKTSRKDYMSRHESKHQETPKYFCDQCEYKSWDYSNFKVHIQVKHGSVVHKCQECDYQSKSSRSLRKHGLKQNHTLTLQNFGNI